MTAIRKPEHEGDFVWTLLAYRGRRTCRPQQLPARFSAASPSARRSGARSREPSQSWFCPLEQSAKWSVAGFCRSKLRNKAEQIRVSRCGAPFGFGQRSQLSIAGLRWHSSCRQKASSVARFLACPVATDRRRSPPVASYRTIIASFAGCVAGRAMPAFHSDASRVRRDVSTDPSKEGRRGR